MNSADDPKYALQVAGKTLRSASGESRAAICIDSLSQGSTFLAAVRRSEVSVEHGQLLLEHLRRTGLLANRNNSVNTSCAHGACVPGEVTSMSDQQRLHCVGCPLSQL